MIPIYIPRVFKESANQAIESGWISSQGPFIEKASTLLKSKLNMPYVILLNNGTSATHMLIKALKFKHPTISKIYAPNNVFVAVWNTILYEYDKSIIEILDMDSKTLNMRTDEKYILSLDKNAAVMIVHNIGNIVNVPRLKRIRPDLIFIEDNCEGLFGKYEDIYSGTSEASLCSAVSFFANKTITSGEGGAFFTHDKELYDFVYCSINHGLSGKKYVYKELGYNYRMTNIQAALLYDQLINVEQIISDKKRVFERYRHNLKDTVVFSSSEKDTECSNWMMVCGVSKSYDYIESYLKSKNIDVRPFFFDITVHTHLQDFKSKKMNNSINYFMVPSYPDLTDTQIDYISDCIKSIPDVHFLTFANTSYMSLDRIHKQAVDMNIFDTINLKNEHDISDFLEKHRNFIMNHKYGFGYYIWKPKIILDTLLKMKENDILLYCDAGTHLNNKGRHRFLEYINIFFDDKYHLVNFSTNNFYKIQQFVKSDAINAYFPELMKREDNCMYAGIMMIKKTNKSIALIQDYLALCENYHFLSDARSITPSHPLFIGNDKDNGLYAMCVLKHNISYFIDSKEVNVLDKFGKQLYLKPNDEGWSLLDEFPILIKRDRPGNN